MGQTLLLLPVITGYAVSGMQAESAVMPGHESFEKKYRRQEPRSGDSRGCER